MKIYPASKAKHAPWWAALRAAGLNIAASWITWPGNQTGADPTPDDWGRNIGPGASRKRLQPMLYCLSLREGATQCGALIEIGASRLSAGKRVFVVSDYQVDDCAPSARPMLRIRLEAAVAALVAAANGERQRNAA